MSKSRLQSSYYKYEKLINPIAATKFIKNTRQRSVLKKRTAITYQAPKSRGLYKGSMNNAATEFISDKKAEYYWYPCLKTFHHYTK